MKREIMYSIGLMSGTSMDGIDAALLKTDGTPNLIERHGYLSLPYEQIFKICLKATEFTIKTCNGDLAKATHNFQALLIRYFQENLGLQQYEMDAMFQTIHDYFKHACVKPFKESLNLNHIIDHSTHLHILAVNALLHKANMSAKQINIIGYHGQAMFHQPRQKISIILGDGQALADAVTIPVINDFRRQDIQMGGQGAPFAPIYHQALAIRDHKIPLIVVNCGGIANVTLIPSSDPHTLTGFDTGPGNGLLDQFVRQRTQGRLSMDVDGAFGQQGKVVEIILEALYSSAVMKEDVNYFSLRPPKSLDYGDLVLIPELANLSLEDGCRTLAAFTADSIVTSVMQLGTILPRHWILAGGGWHNPVIFEEIKQRVKNKIGQDVTVATADEAGWHGAALEAELFAYLAVRSMQQQPISYPNTTGVTQPLTGGTYYKPNYLHNSYPYTCTDKRAT